ncbi:MAG: outer membrane protein transport protein, partial [Deltaproteobacteria bacterium]|nr:outer membrane protein transport protein [Deltaproteobacteria bacterium]
MRIGFVFFLLLTSHISHLTPAFADEYHYNNILIGDRAAGMGGAYTAISDDPSGLFYNPAGIAYTQGSNVSVSANAVHQTRTVYKDVLGGNGWERTSSALLPNFFGIIQPLGKGKLGFSYAVPDSIVEDQDQVFYNIPNITRYVINFNKNDNTYNFGPSYALELAKGLSVGLTIYAHYKDSQWIMNQLTNLNSGQYEWLNQYYQTSEWGIRPIIGLMWNTTDKLSFGLTASQTKVLNSTTTNQVVIKDISYDGNTINRIAIKSDEKRELPLTATLGFAFFPSNTLIIAGDFTYYDKATDNNFGDKQPTWNAALGAEYYLSEKWALRGGLFTDRANTPEAKAGNGIDDFDH